MDVNKWAKDFIHEALIVLRMDIVSCNFHDFVKRASSFSVEETLLLERTAWKWRDSSIIDLINMHVKQVGPSFYLWRYYSSE